ncbi:MAG: PD-(D/E)XK nuclease family protein [Clostridia bacterium]|nr:PD-(D/E)XK nuclease family protein [Clostridia bacterium]
MLKLILGRSGTGKSYRIFEQLNFALEKTESSCILLVPEQITYETEKLLLKHLGPKKSHNVKVLNFTRLAEAIVAASNCDIENLMDDAIRSILLSEALDETADRRSVSKLSFREKRDPNRMKAYLRIITEMKQNNVSADDLSVVAENLQHDVLKDKINDLSLIMNAYDALVAQSYIDVNDLFDKAITFIHDSNLLDGSYVFVDGFSGFTAQEIKLFTAILQAAQEVTVALCADSLMTEDINPFTIPTQTANQVISIAKMHNIDVAEPVYLQENHRYHSKELQVVEQNLFSYTISPCEQSGDVTIMRCSDAYGECKTVVKMIHKILREGGRCNDITIVCRNLSAYRGILDTLMDQEGISYYMDRRENILMEPLIEEILCALKVVSGGWKTEAVLRLMKARLQCFSSHSVSMLENYAYMWNIFGSLWKKEWTASPDGFSTRVSPNAENRLFYLNILRRRLVNPLIRLETALKGEISGEEFATAIYAYLKETQAVRMMKIRIQQLEEVGEPILADRMERVWDATMGILNSMAVTTESKHEVSRYYELFRLVASFTEMGTIPQMMDSIQIGSADRMRFASPKIVFLMGANEGVFPAFPQNGGFLNDRERSRLKESGLELQQSVEYYSAQERYFAYTAASAASEKLYVSYQTASLETECSKPSELVHSIKQILPNVVEKKDNIASVEDIELPTQGLEYLARTRNTPNAITSTVFEAFDNLDIYRESRDRLFSFFEDTQFSFENSAISKELFGLQNLSPTQVEKYYKCPFSYLCRYGLNITSRNRAELNSIEFGNIVHYLLQVLVSRYETEGFDKVTHTQVRKDTKRLVDEYVENYMGGIEGKPARFQYLLSRLEKLGMDTMWFVICEMKQSAFVTTDYELTIGKGKDAVAPLQVELSDGSIVKITGQIDRVDVFKKDDKSFLRVVDYKTGKKEFKLNEVLEGINLQMLIYLTTLWKNGTPHYENVVPAGVVYLPTKLVVLDDETIREKTRDKLEEEQIKSIKTQGLLLDDPEVLEAMEVDGKGLFIPYAANDKKKSDCLASLEQFGVLSNHINSLIKKMMETLQEGTVPAKPTVKGSHTQKETPCSYCDYAPICRHESSQVEKYIKKLSNEEVFEKMQEQTEDK